MANKITGVVETTSVTATSLVGTLTGNVIGNLTGNATGNHSGTLTGDLVGSVFGDDSTTLLDGISKKLTVDTADIDTIEVTNQSLTMSRADDVVLDLVATGTVDMSGQNSDRGEIFFSRSDTGGLKPEAKIAGGRASILMIVDDDTNAFPEANTFIMNNNSGLGGGEVKFGFGIFQPTAKLHVVGDGLFTGTVNAPAFQGDLTLDDSTVVVNGEDGAITAGSFVQFASFTTTERDALTAANGMVIYNTTDNKFQGYENGAWTNLI